MRVCKYDCLSVFGLALLKCRSNIERKVHGNRFHADFPWKVGKNQKYVSHVTTQIIGNGGSPFESITAKNCKCHIPFGLILTHPSIFLAVIKALHHKRIFSRPYVSRTVSVYLYHNRLCRYLLW